MTARVSERSVSEARRHISIDNGLTITIRSGKDAQAGSSPTDTRKYLTPLQGPGPHKKKGP
jgi:hypothetical protein